ETDVQRFTLDLSKPQAQMTYDALLRGDVDAAQKVAAAGGGVTAEAPGVTKWSGEKLAAGLAVKLPNGFGAGLSVYDEKLSAQDPRITQSPMRQKLAADAAARGAPIAWNGSGGALEASLGANATVGVVGVG